MWHEFHGVSRSDSQRFPLFATISNGECAFLEHPFVLCSEPERNLWTLGFHFLEASGPLLIWPLI